MFWIGLFVGAPFGFVICALLVANRDSVDFSDVEELARRDSESK